MRRCTGVIDLTGSEYQELLVFMAVARDRSFRTAARRLAMTPSAVSRSVKRAEARIGVRLLNRTTRSVRATPAGELLIERLAPLFAAVDGALDEVVATSGVAKGAVRLNLPRIAAALLADTLFARFAAAFPDVTLELSIDDDLRDVVGAGFDAGIRVGGRVEQDMAAIRLTPDVRNAVVGTPGYYAAHGRPDRPRDLLRHVCLNYRWRGSGERYHWRFEEDGHRIELAVGGVLSADDTGILLDAALGGSGLACLPDLLVAPLIAAGLLERVLADYCPPQPGFFLYYPLNGHPSAALSSFIDHARSAAVT